METEKKDFLTWCVQNNLLSKEKFEELKTDVSKEELKNVQIKCTVETKKREPRCKHDQDKQTKLIQKYLQAVETVKKDKKLKKIMDTSGKPDRLNTKYMKLTERRIAAIIAENTFIFFLINKNRAIIVNNEKNTLTKRKA